MLQPGHVLCYSAPAQALSEQQCTRNPVQTEKLQDLDAATLEGRLRAVLEQAGAGGAAAEQAVTYLRQVNAGLYA